VTVTIVQAVVLVYVAGVVCLVSGFVAGYLTVRYRGGRRG
jgi:hypothetical protein